MNNAVINYLSAKFITPDLLMFPVKWLQSWVEAQLGSFPIVCNKN